MTDVRASGMPATRRRRRRRAAITLFVVGLMLVATFLYAAAYFQGWVGGSEPTAKPSCVPKAPAVAAAAPAKVTVNVYNATDRNGLAASVAAALRRQGFKIGKIANDPLTRSISGTGEVRHGTKGLAAAVTVRQRLITAALLPDNRADATVDLVLGEAYKALTAPPKAGKPATPKARPTSAAPKATGSASC